jgi:hypothetical protein
MKINAKLASIGLLFAVIISLVWGGHQCSGRQHWEETSGKLAEKLKKDSTRYVDDKARWDKDSVGLIGVIQSQKDQINEARNIATDYRARFEGAVAVSDRQADELSYRDKQISLLRTLVGNKTLSADYLKDLNRVAIPDTAILAAAFKSVKRGEVAQRGVDSLIIATAAQGAEIRKLNTRTERSRSSSLYAQEKLQNLSERKPLFSKSRRRLAREAAQQVRKIREGEISDLERIENDLK